MRKTKRIFKFEPFSSKQKKVLTWWHEDSPVKDKDGIICDGAIRSGKTSATSLSFVMWAMACFNEQKFAMCGKTIGSFRRNVLSDLKAMLNGRGYIITEYRTDNLMIVSKGQTENHFYFFGGKDERSQDLIQGITLAGLFLDEVPLMPRSFVEQAIARCSVEGSKHWFNGNPEGPDHYFKLEFIDKRKELNYLRLHFTMDDNLSLAEEIKARYRRQHSGVFFDRFILGLWVVATGIIFRKFADDPEKWLIDREELFDKNGKLKMVFSRIHIGGDFGGTKSKTAFKATGFTNRWHNMIVLDECSLTVTEDIDAEMICEAFYEFYIKIIETYGRIDKVFLDSASPTLINSIRGYMRKKGYRWGNIVGVTKNEIADRPRTVDMLLNTGRLKIVRDCRDTIKAIASLRWDDEAQKKHKKDIPEDKNFGNINDDWDGFCYSWIEYTEAIDLNRGAA